MSDSWKDCEGQVVAGEFPLVQHLGGSDHSVVFLTQRGKNKSEKAAIKFIQADAANADLQISRWKQAAQLSHPNLIRLFETGRCHLAGMDLLFVVMEFAQENLAQFLPERPLSPAETRDMLEPFVETLAFLHGRGFVHGRVNPRNILAIDDQLKLSSDSVSPIGEARNALERPDVYTAPESASSAIAAGDVWSLGVTLVETLTQRVPEPNEGGELQIPDSLPEPFLDIVRHSLHRDPRTRWTVADISTRINSPALTTSPSAAISEGVATALPEPIKPAAAKPAAAPARAEVSAANQPSASAKPVASVDPLSVPLSMVPPLSTSKQHSLENQLVAGQATSYRSYYIAVAILVALTVGAMIAIPRLRDRQSDLDATSEPTTPAVQPEHSLTPTKVTPPEVSNSRPQKDQPIDRTSQRPAVESLKNSQDSMKTASERELLRKDSASESEPAAKAPSSAAVVRTPSPAPSMAIPIASPGAVTQGEVLNQILPEVSAKSRSTIHGTVRVIVKVFVNASGDVTSVEPASVPSKFFGDAALEAAQKWDFAPAKIGSQSVPSEWLVRFDFTQTDTKVLPLQAKP